MQRWNISPIQFTKTDFYLSTVYETEVKYEIHTEYYAVSMNSEKICYLNRYREIFLIHIAKMQLYL